MTTLMQAYQDAKQAHPDKLVLFRVGGTYQIFGPDAKRAAGVLDIPCTLTDGPMRQLTGFPAIHLEGYLQRLLQAGYRIAVCEPVESTEVRRVVTVSNGGTS